VITTNKKYINNRVEKTHPTEDVLSSFFESVIVINDTCLVVSILQDKITRKLITKIKSTAM